MTVRSSLLQAGAIKAFRHCTAAIQAATAMMKAVRLMRVEGSFSHSDFVMKTTGADSVCERSAAAGGGKIIVSKQMGRGVTFAAAETRVTIDFERDIL